MFRRLTGITGFVVCCAAHPGAAQAPRVAEIQIAPPFVRMIPEAQVQASATAYDSAGTPVVVRFRWTSSNINVATVSENGLVRGVAPGMALISAVFEGQRGGRRRAMQVQVMARPGAAVTMTPVIPNSPMMPGTPPTTSTIPPTAPGAPAPGSPTPGTPPTTMVHVTPHAMDSTFKASINCNEPMMNVVNPLMACYSQRPTPRVPAPASVAACPPPPANVPGMPGMGGGNNNGVLVLVRVNETGAVTETMPFVRGGCPELIQGAIAAARTMTFNPALKDGQPIAAWARVMIRTTELPPKQ